MKPPVSNEKGLTLIELLIVIAVIGALAGILINVIDAQKQKRTAEDGAKRLTINDYANSLEAYRTVEGSYPAEGTSNNPLDASATSGDIAAIYISEWLPGYVYNTDVDGSEFSLHIRKSSDTSFLKYTSDWQEIRECGETTDESSITACD